MAFAAECNSKCFSGCASAQCVTSDAMCDNSVDSAFRNFLRAGVLKKRSRTVIEVPNGSPASSTRAIFPPLISTTVPAVSCSPRVSSRSRDTDAIAGSASPRNPSVATLSRSSAFLIFEVACRSNANMASSRPMPHPLSVIWISLFPPRLHADLDPRRPRIQRIFQHLLHHRRRPLHHLARGDLVGYGFGEYVDASHGWF